MSEGRTPSTDHVCDRSCAHTVDVGYVHVLTAPRVEGGYCVVGCPHPDHKAT